MNIGHILDAEVPDVSFNAAGASRNAAIEVARVLCRKFLHGNVGVPIGEVCPTDSQTTPSKPIKPTLATLRFVRAACGHR